MAIALPLSMLGVIWPEARVELDRSLGALGAVTSTYGIARMATATAGRRLARRCGMSAAFTVSLLGLVVACCALAAAASWPQFLAAAAAVGVTSGLLDSLVTLHLATRADVSEAALVHGLHGVGATIGPLVVAVMPEWRSPVLVAAVAGLGAVGVVVRARGAWSPLSRDATGSVRTGAQPVPQRAIVISLGVFAAIVAAEVTTGQWAYVWLTEGRSVDATTAAAAVAAFWAGSTLTRLAMSWHPVATVVDRWGLPRLAALAPAILVAMAALPDLPGLLPVAGFATTGATLGPIVPTLFATTAHRVGAEHAEKAAGWQLLAFNVGAIAGLALTGVLVERFGATVIVPAVAVLLVTTGVPLLTAARTRSSHDSLLDGQRSTLSRTRCRRSW